MRSEGRYLSIGNNSGAAAQVACDFAIPFFCWHLRLPGRAPGEIPCISCNAWGGMCVSCLPQLSVDGQTVTTGRGYPDVRSVRIEREDILYGYAAQPSTPLRVLLISAPLTGSIIHSEPESKVDTSGRALLLLAQTLVTGQVLARCMSKAGELKHSYVMVKTYEHLLSQKLDAIVADCAAMVPAASSSGRLTPEIQQACLRCFVESVVHEHVMQSLARLWADDVARFAACCDAIKATDTSLPPPPPASAVSQQLSSLNAACCYTQKAEILQGLLDAILFSATGVRGAGDCGVLSTDDLLPYIIAFACAHARDGCLLLHVVFCDSLQHTLLTHGEWGFTLSLFKSAVVYVAAQEKGSASSGSAASAAGFLKGAARKNSVTSLAAALGSGGGSSASIVLQQPQSVPPYRRPPPTQASRTLHVAPSNMGSSSFTRPPAVIVPDVQRGGVGGGGGGSDGRGGSDRHMLGSFLSSLIDDD